MTLFHMLDSNFTLTIYLELLLRIVVAAVCGILVGLERTRRFKDAGVRTHSIVACTAAIMMIVSKYGFADMGTAGTFFAGTRGADPARIAAQIVSGISFLGVGIIYRDKHFSTKGLTTAAGIWAVAGIGMSIGAGMYVIGLFATAFVVFLQWLMHRYAIGNDRYTGAVLAVVMNDDPQVLERIHKQFDKWGVVITDSAVTREEGKLTYEAELKLPSQKVQHELTDYLATEPDVCSIELGDLR